MVMIGNTDTIALLNVLRSVTCAGRENCYIATNEARSDGSGGRVANNKSSPLSTQRNAKSTISASLSRSFSVTDFITATKLESAH
jgi:hypothetical protein